MKSREYEHTKAINIAKIRENYICELCGSNKDLEGHHIEDYAFNGEADSDKIMVVCKSCHDDIHNGKIKIKSYDYRN